LEQLLIDRELHLAREMLASDETFDHSSDAPLLLDVDKRFKLHRRREGSKSGKYFWMPWGLEGVGFEIDADRLVGRSGINQIRQVTVAVQLGKVLT